MTFECQGCLLEVEKIPIFKEGECEKDIQHYFVELEDE